jgi:hypothetical protein
MGGHCPLTWAGQTTYHQGRRVVEARRAWNAEAERFTNNEAANALLHYEYRKPWSLE